MLHNTQCRAMPRRLSAAARADTGGARAAEPPARRHRARAAAPAPRAAARAHAAHAAHARHRPRQ